MDYSDAEYSEDDYCTADDSLPEDYSDEDEVEDGDDGLSDAEANDRTSRPEQNYTVLSEAEIRRLQEEDVNHLSNILSISTADSSMLLLHYNWNVSKVQDEWFADEAKVREAVGLLDEPAAEISNSQRDDVLCRICFEVYSFRETSAAACGHQFCRDCWRGYISTSINDGPGCLTLRCPDPSCSVAVHKDMVELLVSEEDMEKYFRYLLRSYVEDNKKRKWCPGPGCDLAVKSDGGGVSFQVLCRCGHAFCWNCAKEAHRPVGCETVAKWVLKNKSESENTTWILANSKPCPKCKRPIEKNHGCMHMTCGPPCRFQFCWLCLGDWSDHGVETGGFYACNRYAEAKQKGELDEEETIRNRARSSVIRYTHYYERWASNRASTKKAHQDLQSMQAEKLEELFAKLNLPMPASDLKFVTEAWEQIVECRRVLTWTYVYGYYFPVDEQAKKELFEYLQGQAEAGLERLHKCTEKELQDCFDVDHDKAAPSVTLQGFMDFRIKLTDLTNVTRNYFENLVHALETGLQEVDSEASRSNIEAKITITYADFEDGDEDWACGTCTFVNPITFDTCEVCQSYRPIQA